MKPIKLAAIAVGIIAIALLGGIVALFAAFDAPRIKAEVAKAVHDKTGRTLKIEGDVSLFFWPNVGVRIGSASLSETGSEERFAAINGARVSVAVMPLLSKQIVVREIELDGAEATLVKRHDGSLNIDDLTGKGKPVAEKPDREAGKQAKPPMSLDVSSVRIANARLTWRDEQSNKTATISGLDFATGRITGDTGKGSYDIEGVKLGLKGTSGTDSIALKLEMPKIALAGDEAQTLTISRIGGGIDLESPRMPMKSLKLPLDGQLRGSLANQTFEGSLATRIDDSNVKLAFNVTRFAPLALGFDLDIDRIDVDKYLPPTKPGDAKSTHGAGETGKEAHIDLTALKGLDLHGAVHIGRLQISNVKAGDVKLKLKLAGGRLDVAPHSMNLYGGRLQGALSVSADGNVVAMRENIVDIDINPLMRDLADKNLIEGHGDVRLDVITHGDTLGAMKKALGGSATVALANGALKGINLAQTFREAKAMISGKQDAVQQARLTDKTDFTEMTASFRIANGVARNDDLSAKSPFLRLAGSGDIDVGNGRLDYLAKASVVGTSGGQGAKELAQLQGLTIPVRATGPFDKLSYKIEYAAIAEGALKAKVDEKKEELKQRAKEELLKGIFGK
jgi:AsmA protein